MSSDRQKLMVFPRNVLVGSHAIRKVGEIAKDLDPGDHALIISDNFSRKNLHKDVTTSLEEQGFSHTWDISPGPTMKSVQIAVKKGREAGATFVMGVGGGSAIDVAKLTAFELGVPFISVPTTASHDGICSGRASIKETRGNVSKEARPPSAIIADTSVISKAPYEMLASGCADVISNLTAVKDWQLAHRLKNEEYSTFAATLAKSGADMILDHVEDIRANLEESSWYVVKSLIVSGVSMAVAGNSRPASGAEHMFSHMLDKIMPGAAMHGNQVGIGSILMMNLHGGDWKQIRDALQALGAPVTAKELGVPPKKILEALTTCHTLRPERYTILGESGLTLQAAKKLCKECGIF